MFLVGKRWSMCPCWHRMSASSSKNHRDLPREISLSQEFFRGIMVKQVHAAHILVKDEAKARELLVKVKAGDSFSELAKKFSICPSGKKGGDLGWFGRGQMVREFENAAFDGEKGNAVGPVKTQFGWHLIKVLEKR